MKSIFTKLSTLLLCGAVALVGCSDFSADLREVNERLEDLEATAATKAEVAVLKAEVEELKKLLNNQYATKEDVAKVEATVEAVKKDLKDAQDAFTAALDNKADKTALEKAVNDIQTALETAKGEFKTALEGLASENETLKGNLQALVEKVEKLQGDVTAKLETIDGNIETLQKDLDELTSDVDEIQKALDSYKETVDKELEEIKDGFEKRGEELDEKFGDIDEQFTSIGDQLTAINNSLTDLASADTDLAAKDKEIEEALDKLEEAFDDFVKNAHQELVDKVNDLIKETTDNYKDLSDRIDALEDALLDLEDKVEDMVTSLRSVVLIPETVYNGTKAVKFHRMEGENVMKTFAYVSFHFNPSNFDLESATYEVMAENVEFMTKAATETPAITIVGKPVKNGDKVTFLFERAEGAGNMFALKVTLADGNVIYSEYAAILDEITYCVADATMKMDVQRLVFEMPTITSLSELIELVQCAGTKLEDFQLTIDTIKGAYEALQTNNLLAAFDLIKSLPGFTTKVVTLTGKGHCEEIVESITAEKLLEELKNSLDLGFDEFLKKFNDLLGLAGGLGQDGSDILEGLENSFANSQINGSLGQLEEAIKAFDASEVAYENTKKILDAAEAEAAKEKSQLDEKQATYEAEKAKLDAISNKLSLEYIKQSAVVTAAWTAVESAELAVRIADAAIPAAKENLEKAKENVDKLEAKIEEIKQQIKDQTKDYIENSELGQKIKELENAIAEKNWEVQKNTAKYLAEIKAVKMASEDIMSNYKALNQQVVDEFNCSIFGRILAILNTTEAEKVFEELCLTELYNALKLLPDMITTATKYYPALNLNTLEDFSTLIKDITTGAEGTLQGALDSLVKGEMPELNINSEYLTVESSFRVEYELAE